MSNTKTIPLLLATDSRGIKGLAVTVKSVLVNRKNCTYEVFIIEDGVSDAVKKTLEDNWRETISDLKVHWFNLSTDTFSKYRTWRGSRMIYGRLYVGDVIQHHDKCIYLDIDIIAKTSLLSLYETDLQGKVLGAVEDDWRKGTLNAGVMLIDIKQWKKENILQKCIKILKENPWLTVQGALNQLLSWEEWQQLDRTWNSCTTEEVTHAGTWNILHYQTKIKPWQSDDSKFIEFYKYLDMTSFKGWRPEELENVNKKSFQDKLKEYFTKIKWKSMQAYRKAIR